MAHLNIINSYLAYDDQVTTDNPRIRAFDITRQIFCLAVCNPVSYSAKLAPGETFTLFDGTVASGLDGTSILSVSLLPNQQSLYRFTVTAGSSGFRTARTVTSLATVNVTVNNNAVATFDFTTATLTGIQVGDILRISGQLQNDPPPYAFNPLNAGLWTIIGISGTVLSCVRPVGVAFSGVTESVTALSSDVQIYSSAGIQVGSNVSITGTFSQATWRTYQVQAVTPTTFDVTSVVPIPNESGLSYVTNSIVFYTDAKRFVYVEVDQDAVLNFNGNTGNTDILNPIVPGDPCLKGFASKMGSSFSAAVTNISVNTLKLSYYLAE